MAEWSKALPLTAWGLSPMWACPNGWVVKGIATDCLRSLTNVGLSQWLSGQRHCHWLLEVSHQCGPVLMAEWSKALPLTAWGLSPMWACPNGWVVKGIATDCLRSLTNVGLPQWLSGQRHCHWLIEVSHQWGPAPMAEWSKALPLTAWGLSPMWACPNGWVVKGIATDCLLSLTDGWMVKGIATDWLRSLTNEGLPQWLSGQRHCHWLLEVSHQCGPVLMAEWSKALPLTAWGLSPMWACPNGWVVKGIATDCLRSLTNVGLP